MGKGRRWDPSPFRGELSSRPGLAVVNQILSNFFSKSNIFNLTAATTQAHV